MKTAFIMRGLPGSGKSCLADLLKGLLMQMPVVVSADHFFTDKDGHYEFDPTKISQAHEQCKERFYEAVEGNINTIIVDNTNVLYNHWIVYADHARANGYQVITCVVEEWDAEKCAKRGSHGVPLEVTKRMAQEFQR